MKLKTFLLIPLLILILWSTCLMILLIEEFKVRNLRAQHDKEVKAEIIQICKNPDIVEEIRTKVCEDYEYQGKYSC